MKNILNLFRNPGQTQRPGIPFLFAAIVAMVGFSMASCDNPANGGSQTDPSPLATPVISIDDGVVSWPSVPGAGGYSVYRTHAGATTTYDLGANVNSFDLLEDGTSPLPFGIHQVRVRALGVAGQSEDLGITLTKVPM